MSRDRLSARAVHTQFPPVRRKSEVMFLPAATEGPYLSSGRQPCTRSIGTGPQHFSERLTRSRNPNPCLCTLLQRERKAELQHYNCEGRSW